MTHAAAADEAIMRQQKAKKVCDKAKDPPFENSGRLPAVYQNQGNVDWLFQR